MNCLKESTFCQPRVHTVWSALSRILLPDSVLPQEDAATITDSLKKQKKGRKGHPSEEETAKNLRNFVEVVIDGSLMSSSHDRKHLAFDILLNLVPKVPASLIAHTLSYKLVHCLVDVLSTKDSWLYKIAENFLQKLSDWVKDDDVRRVGVVMALQRHINGKFDIVTRTKTVKNLMAEFQTEPGCMLFIQSLTSMFVDEGTVSDEPSDQSQTTDENSELGSTEDRDTVSPAGNVEYLKSWVIESIPGVLKHLKLEPEAKFRVQKEILKFLAVQGLFTASLGSEVTSFELQEKFRWPKAAASSALCGMCIEQLQSVLASNQKGEGLRASLNSNEQNDLGSFFIRFFCTLRSIPSVSLFRALSDDDKSALEKLQETENMLSREERSTDPSVEVHKLHALRYLLIQLLLQVLLRPGEFAEAASELSICCKKVLSSADAQDSSGEDEVNGDGTPELMDVLVDTLLSLLPQSSAPLRSAIEQVFKYFCSEITDDGLRRMIRVIKKDLTPPRHATVESEDESDDEQDEDFLDIEEDEDAEYAEDTDMDKTVDNDEITDDSEAAVAVAENNREVAENSDEESDEGMDDEAMFRMDTYLARIFKERKNQSGGSGPETAQSQLVLFKLRVLSLLEIYLHENPGKSQVVTVFSNLAQAYVRLQNAESSGQLGERIWVILQKKYLRQRNIPRATMSSC
ncbi:hypothetical protein MLD38_026945 [Melastoma candidum]|uniref:Uncharacterized protein n=1 Tax=Melastoma candidum TaxID=119954 RepID=A0ACB9P6F0_9MYRT|nr:hypothetical protein MLD38_026945 [Melastoma candidum]